MSASVPRKGITTPIERAPIRKGAIRMADIAPDVRQALNQGTIEAVTLVEALVVDHGQLLRAIAADAGPETLAAMDATMDGKITSRMKRSGAVLYDRFGMEEGLARFITHRSDTVRGWAASIIGYAPGLKLPERLRLIAVLADDPNPGTREWAWMAVRPHIAADLERAIKLLTRWTAEPSANLRRFATESTRPRGVWCAHIQALKHDPAIALPLLDPLLADPTKYVQDSVANWLNDASKTQPDFVVELCRSWLQTAPTKATERICRRAMRSLRAQNDRMK